MHTDMFIHSTYALHMLPSNCWDATLEHVHTAQKSLHSPVIAETALNLFTHTAHKSMHCEVTACGNQMLNLCTCSAPKSLLVETKCWTCPHAQHPSHCWWKQNAEPVHMLSTQVTAGGNKMLNLSTCSAPKSLLVETKCWTCPHARHTSNCWLKQNAEPVHTYSTQVNALSSYCWLK